MKKITFINPPIKLGRTFAHYPLFSNLGMLQNAAVLEKNGFNVSVIDAFFINDKINYREIENDLFHLGAELSFLQEVIRKRDAEIFIIPITMFSDVEKLDETYIPEISNLIKKYHKNSILIAADCYVCGMNYFAYDPVKLLKSIKEIDINLRGETDITLLETIRHLSNYGLNNLPYGTFREKNEIILKEDIKHYPKDLNLLSYPAFHLLNMDNYFRVLAEAAKLDLIHEYHKAERFLPLMTSRGCLFSCNFCTQQVLGMPYRYYSVQYLKKEINYFKKKYRADRFFFLDNNINAEINRFEELISFLSEMRISWDAVNGFRADKLTKSHIKKIKMAGNTKITISAESGDPDILSNVINKNLKLKSVIDVAKWAYELNFNSQVHYIIGMIGEDITKMNKTLEFAEMLYEKYNSWPLLQHAIPFRKTRLYFRCKEKGYFTRDPDSTPTHHLEHYPIIKTEKFSSEDVFTIKNHFLNKFKFYETTSFIVINNSCNNSCIHCEISDILNKREIKPQEIDHQLKNAKKRGHHSIIITGGEPTINHKNLFHTLNYARRLKIPNIALATNGRMLIYTDFVRDILKYGINQISVSINSADPVIHDKITRINNSFHHTIKGIHNLITSGLKNININIRITSVNQGGIKDIIKMFSSKYITGFYIRIALPLGNIEKNNYLLPDLKEVSEILNETLSLYPDQNIKIIGLPFCMLNKKYINHLTSYPPLYNERYRNLKTKTPQCLGCIHYISCMGFYRPEYNNYYKQIIQ